jgi:hypothetical protein
MELHENNGKHGGGVFSSGRKSAFGAQKGIETPCAKRITGADWKKSPCTSVEQEENHEKGPRWSWARNQMGNVN